MTLAAHSPSIPATHSNTSFKLGSNSAPASDGDDHMAKIVMTDNLPTDMELVGNSSQTQDHKACFTGNSLANDNAQSGCDTTVIKVHVPPTPTPTPTPTPAPQPAVLPNIGAGNFIVPAVVVSILGYAGYLLRLKRRTASKI
ncbi:MAG TPA: hypothetical protein VGG13_00700 [Candidatus Saccharimonadales bacterium]|jgi:hypothetical protein